jgi:hypothetical protein
MYRVSGNMKMVVTGCMCQGVVCSVEFQTDSQKYLQISNAVGL